MRQPTKAEAGLYRTLENVLAASDEEDWAKVQELVMDALDGIVGWCHPSCHVFPGVDFSELVPPEGVDE